MGHDLLNRPGVLREQDEAALDDVAMLVPLVTP
jgi:hypothetical protein